MNKKILTLLFAGVLMGALDIAIVGPALPALQKVFNIDIRELPWVFNVYLLFNIVSTPIMAKLSDMNGRRGIYILSIALFAIGSLVIVFAHTYNAMLVGRAIQGLGSGGIFPIATAVIGDTVEKDKQGRALGMIGMVFGIAFILGPIIGGLLLMINWKLIFLINLPIAIALIYYAYKLLPVNKKETAGKFDWLGMIMLISSLSLFTWAVNQVDSNNFFESIGHAHVMYPFIISLVLLPVYYFHEHRHSSPITDTKLLHSKQLRVTYFLAFTAGLGQTVPMFLPNYCHEAFGMNDSSASFSLIPMVIALAIGAPTAGRLLDKFGARNVLMGGISLVIIGLLLFILLGHALIGYYSSLVVLGFGLSAIIGAPLRYIMNQETTSGDRASGQALISLFTSSGQMITAALLGALIASMGKSADAYRHSILWLVYFIAVALLVSLQLKKKE